MKSIITNIFLLFSFNLLALAQPSVLDKQISLNIYNEDFEIALDEISVKGNVHFSYRSDIIDGNQQVSIKVDNQSIREILKLLTQEKNLEIQVVDNTIIFSKKKKTEKKIKISGFVKDSCNNPVEYAAIIISSQPLGTATNAEGFFHFEIPEELINDSVVISALSYNPVKIPVKRIVNSNSNYQLKSKTFLLKSVKVAGNTQAEEIFLKAVKNFKKNYPIRTYHFDGFFRELIREDNDYKLLTEAIISATDYGYKTDSRQMKIKINHLRKSNDYRNIDSLGRCYEKRRESGGNELYHIFYFENLRFSLTNWNGFGCALFPSVCDAMLKYWKINLDSNTYINNKLVHCLTFQGNEKYNKWLKIKMFIDANSFAVVQYEEIYDKNARFTKGDKKGLLVEDAMVTGKKIIKYSEYKEKYYLSYFSVWENIWGGSRDKKKLIEFERNVIAQGYECTPENKPFLKNEYNPEKGNFHQYLEFYVTKIYDKKEKFQKIKEPEAMPKNKFVFNNQCGKYDENVWKNLRIQNQNPYLEKAINDISKFKPLEQQFKENSGK